MPEGTFILNEDGELVPSDALTTTPESTVTADAPTDVKVNPETGEATVDVTDQVPESEPPKDDGTLTHVASEAPSESTTESDTTDTLAPTVSTTESDTTAEAKSFLTTVHDLIGDFLDKL